jgi:uncharacterized membrane protein
MSDQPPPPSPVPPTSPGSPPAVENAPTERELAEGKPLAILCYALNFAHVPFWIAPLIMRSNRFALYHAKQCLMLFIAMAVLAAAGVVVGLATMGCGMFVIIPLLVVGGVALNIVGLVNAVGGQMRPLPVIGVLAERWLAGIAPTPP